MHAEQEQAVLAWLQSEDRMPLRGAKQDLSSAISQKSQSVPEQT